MSKYIYNGLGHGLSGRYTKGKEYELVTESSALIMVVDDTGKKQVEFMDNFSVAKAPVGMPTTVWVVKNPSTNKRVWGEYVEGKAYAATKKGDWYCMHDGMQFNEHTCNFHEVNEPSKDSDMSMPKAVYAPWHLLEPSNDTIEVRHAIKKQKQIAKSVLEQLSIMDSTAIVAGGAPRNWSQGKVANDIDVYMYLGEHRQCGDVLRSLKKLFGDSMVPLGLTAMEISDVTQTARKDCDYDQMNIRWVFEGKVFGETVQFIIMKEPTFRSVLSAFDCSICKVWFNGHRIIEEPEYALTMKTGVVYIKDPEGKQNRHLEKMYKYYAQLGFVFTKDTIAVYSSEPKTRNDVTPWTPNSKPTNEIPW